MVAGRTMGEARVEEIEFEADTIYRGLETHGKIWGWIYAGFLMPGGLRKLSTARYLRNYTLPQSRDHGSDLSL